MNLYSLKLSKFTKKISSNSSNVKDMASVLDITVFDEDRDHKVR